MYISLILKVFTTTITILFFFPRSVFHHVPTVTSLITNKLLDF